MSNDWEGIVFEANNSSLLKKSNKAKKRHGIVLGVLLSGTKRDATRLDAGADDGGEETNY